MTFLELCQDLVKELGIAGGSGPSAVTGQTGELANVVRWVAEADLWIQNERRDWKFLHTDYARNLSVGNRVPLAPNTPSGVLVRQWNRESFYLDKTAASWSRLKFVPWYEFREKFDPASGTLANARPAFITIKPDNTLLLNWPPDTGYVLTGEFWRRPVRLAANGDTSLIPSDYHRAIICRAAIMYANREDAPEILNGMEAEYLSIMSRLVSDQVYSQEEQAMGAGDTGLDGAIPGVE